MDLECIISNAIQQGKIINTKDIYMKFYDETKPLYLKTDTSGIGLGTALLQTRDGKTCP